MAHTIDFWRSGPRFFLINLVLALLWLPISGRAQLPPIIADTVAVREVYLTNGFRIAELTTDGAILWTRLCGQKKPNPITHARQPGVFRHPVDFDDDLSLAQLDGGVSGASGYVRAVLVSGQESHSTDWHEARADHDYIVHMPLEELRPNTAYVVTVEGRSPTADTSQVRLTGSFRTPPAPNVPTEVNFTTSTCQYFWSHDDSLDGFKTYRRMADLKPDFFVQTGDYVYYDKPGPHATTPKKARHKWHAMNGWPSLVDFFRITPTYLIKDDHDLLSDDSGPHSADYGRLSYAEGLAIWEENAPVRDQPYRTVRWGKDLQIWLLEGREYRSANRSPDRAGKTILGNQQKAWLAETLDTSTATFKVVVSATPVVGPDRESKTDNHANAAFRTEGQWLRNLLSGHPNTYVINGDRHWQYASRDPATGLREFGSGPASDDHVQGWNEGKQAEHVYLNLIGGFLGVRVAREGGRPFITFTHYDTAGEARHTERFELTSRSNRR